jgi:hypothetical protein
MHFEKSRAELDNCNFIKTVLMTSIVLYHSIAFWLPGGWFTSLPEQPSKSLGLIAIWLNSFHTYGFVLVSGYIFYALKYENKKYQQYGAFVRNKAKRLLIPYTFVSLIWVVPADMVFFQSQIHDIISKYLFMQSPSQLWFLIMLFMVFVLYFPMSDFINKHMFFGLCFMVICYGSSIVGEHFLPNTFQILAALRYLLFFYLGVAIRKYGLKNLQKIP